MRTYKTPTGELPSVTTILDILDKPWLRLWYGKLGNETANKIKEESAARGIWVHDYIEQSYADKPLDIKTIPDICLGYCQSFDKFKTLFPLEKIGSEVMVWSKQGFAGTLDFIGDDGKFFYLLDWKTSSQVSFQHVLQVCFYAYAAWEQGVVVGSKPVIPMVVRLKADGSAPELIEVLHWREIFDGICLSALKLFEANRAWRKFCVKRVLLMPEKKFKKRKKKGLLDFIPSVTVGDDIKLEDMFESNV